MATKDELYKSDACGNRIQVVEEIYGKPGYCGQNMRNLKKGTDEAKAVMQRHGQAGNLLSPCLDDGPEHFPRGFRLVSPHEKGAVLLSSQAFPATAVDAGIPSGQKQVGLVCFLLVLHHRCAGECKKHGE
jgi:hypothetical protein